MRLGNNWDQSGWKTAKENGRRLPRKKRGLLTSDEIKQMRRILGMSQREFADFIGVGEASVKRWETWLVQNKSTDLLMRARGSRKNPMPKFKAGETHTIYSDPFTKQQPEGEAVLIKLGQYLGGQIEYWWVRFSDEEEEVYRRMVH